MNENMVQFIVTMIPIMILNICLAFEKKKTNKKK